MTQILYGWLNIVLTLIYDRWKHELLYRRTVLNFEKRLNLYSNERDKIELVFEKEAKEYSKASPSEKAKYSKSCFELHSKKIEEWLSQIEQVK